MEKQSLIAGMIVASVFISDYCYCTNNGETNLSEDEAYSVGYDLGLADRFCSRGGLHGPVSKVCPS